VWNLFQPLMLKHALPGYTNCCLERVPGSFPRKETLEALRNLEIISQLPAKALRNRELVFEGRTMRRNEKLKEMYSMLRLMSLHRMLLRQLSFEFQKPGTLCQIYPYIKIEGLMKMVHPEKWPIFS